MEYDAVCLSFETTDEPWRTNMDATKTKINIYIASSGLFRRSL